MIPHYVFFWGALLLICGYALWRGQRDERVAAFACLIASLVTIFVIPPVTERYSSPDATLLLIDVAMLATFTAVALRSDRFWPLWVAGLQLTMTMSHLMKTLEPDLMRRVYMAASVFWSYPILIVILVGTWRTHRRSASRTFPSGRPSPA
jgi:hypothetical protein